MTLYQLRIVDLAKMNINIKTKLIISSQKLLTVAIINVLAANIAQTMAPTRKLHSTMDKP